jgi:hypothetical protein
VPRLPGYSTGVEIGRAWSVRPPLRLLYSGSGTLRIDDLAGEGEALAATWAAAERLIGAARAVRAGTGGLANVGLTNGIADADDHDAILSAAMIVL